MGGGHFLPELWVTAETVEREKGRNQIEQELRAHGASTYFIVLGTNVVGGYDDLDERFNAWPLPAIVDLRGNWVGDLPAWPVIYGGTISANSPKLGDAADALLYIAPRDALTVLMMTRAELEGTAYAKELDRRAMIRGTRPTSFLPETPEAPSHQRPARGPLAPPSEPLPPLPQFPLPPRPPSR